MEMNGLMVVVAEAKMAERISLSCFIQWVHWGVGMEESLEDGQGLSPVT